MDRHRRLYTFYWTGCAARLARESNRPLARGKDTPSICGSSCTRNRTNRKHHRNSSSGGVLVSGCQSGIHLAGINSQNQWIQRDKSVSKILRLGRCQPVMCFTDTNRLYIIHGRHNHVDKAIYVEKTLWWHRCHTLTILDLKFVLYTR